MGFVVECMISYRLHYHLWQQGCFLMDRLYSVKVNVYVKIYCENALKTTS